VTRLVTISPNVPDADGVVGAGNAEQKIDRQMRQKSKLLLTPKKTLPILARPRLAEDPQKNETRGDVAESV
jgi:hypothetical protein